MRIGALQLNALPVAVADAQPSADVDLLLGYDFVSHVHVWLSHSSSTVFLQYPSQPTPVAP